ncbi:MAG: heavy metal translocating P-type ATPase [Gemmatimonadota bacterium]|nr:heavy metal translocating P-type ATPase [Gemmatimonadota bacterium]MDH5283346.1 heavy metal translocating P-type ATPase [Gemmatimonadota bacterium]
MPLATLLVLVIGLALRVGPMAHLSHPVLMAGLVLLGLPVVWQTVRGAIAGRFASDLVATLAITGAAILEQPLPGLVVVLMQTGGESLEHFAAGRASRAVEELEARAPRRANRKRGAVVEEIPAEDVEPGDLLLIRPGDMVPCDGKVVEGRSHIDASGLTGEPMPKLAEPGVTLLSGSLNLEGPLVLEATARSGESQYARIVQLVRGAQASKSPLQRMADRYAIWFTPLTLLVCLAAWLATHDGERVLAVLVVATPCPLILATPVAMIGGISRAASRSVIIRNGQALERLGRVTVALLDKTGTLTIGRPGVIRVIPAPPFGENELLRLAAAADQGSGHLLARSVVATAEERGLVIPAASNVVEHAGSGVVADIEGRRTTIGSRAFADRVAPGATDWPIGDEAGLCAWVTVDGRAGGIIEFADRIRPEAAEMISLLRALGLRHIALVTGDHAAHAEAVARAIGVTETRANLLPEDKVRAVEELERKGERVLMVGDGTNDAPALSRASVGVALAAHGGGITAEAADVVVLTEDARRVAEAVTISRATMRIALQSIWAGLGLSVAAMAFAALGHIPPTAGALLQEVIDLAVILNALRASRA